MTELTGITYRMYRDKINIADLQVGDKIESTEHKTGVVYSTKNMVRAAFPQSEDKMKDLWLASPQPGKLVVASYGWMSKENKRYEATRSLLDKVE